MRYLCIMCDDIFKAESDKEVKWKRDYPVCKECAECRGDKEEE